MSIFSHPEYDQHEQVSFYHDPDTGLQAIIAVHNTNRGPALGGCRMWHYASDTEALTDVLRLSRGMTYKSALANLDLGAVNLSLSATRNAIKHLSCWQPWAGCWNAPATAILQRKTPVPVWLT
ncbi:Glu/Leu/Phe/Val dehydrogenase dimerization domain-containing protein [Aliamphritea spongicola]|nr:Glu/Leu/Phe/Val dehydrogenase dimerization domain-containing protein [Aliamphritea spongicola]